MALKPNGETCPLKEQIIEDPVSGLTIQIAHVPGTSAPYRIKLFGNIPNGNRELVFNEDGEMTGAGTLLQGFSAPGWLQEVK